MLERQALVIHPKEAAGRRVLADAGTGVAVGYARWRRRALGAVLEVRELEDEPLVFTLGRSWFLLGRRVVRDAEGKVVGFVGSAEVQDRWGYRLARRGTGESRFRGKAGQDLAVLERVPEGWRLTFSGELEGEPFVKMLLLAAVLVE
jgi:hypothetical protein